MVVAAAPVQEVVWTDVQKAVETVVAAAVLAGIKNHMLVLELTHDCDLSCPWCVVEPRKCPNGVLDSVAVEKFLNIIKDNPRTEYGIQGGEPLLYPEHLFEIMDWIRRLQPDSKLSIASNATHLTKDVVQELNSRQVQCMFSMDADGYKGLMNLVCNAVKPDRIFNNIREVEHKSIRVVYERGTEFAVRALTVLNVFPETAIEMVPNYFTMCDWTDEDFKIFEAETVLLKRIAGPQKRNIFLGQGFRELCPVTEKEYFCFDTHEIEARCDPSLAINGGCPMFEQRFGVEGYERYRLAVDRYLKED